MKATGRWWVVALAAIVGLALAGCSDFNTNGDEIQGVSSGTNADSTDGTETADETGTDGLEYTLNDAKTAYSVSAGTVTSGDVVIPSTHEGLPVTEVKSGGFKEIDGITSVTLPSSIVTIGAGAFYHCSFSQITIPSSVTTIGTSAFAYSSISSIDLASVTTVGGEAFEGCTSLQSVDAGAVTSLGSACFAESTALKSVVLCDSLTSIEDATFDYCSSFDTIDLPDGLAKIGGRAFRNTKLTSVTIPAGVTSIGVQAFQLCSLLASVTVLATTPPTLEVAAFSSDPTVYVPSSAVSDYESASYWSDLTIEAISS